MVTRWPAHRTDTPRPGRSRSPSRQTSRPARTAAISSAITAGSRWDSTRIPSRSRKRDESGELWSSELLGHGGDRHPGELGVRAGEVPVAAVRKRDDGTGARVRRPHAGLVDRLDPGEYLSRRPAGECEHLVHVAQVGADRRPGQPVVDRLTGGQGQVVSQHLDMPSRKAHGEPGQPGDARRHQRSGDAVRRPPTEPEQQAQCPVPGPGTGRPVRRSGHRPPWPGAAPARSAAAP